MAIEFDLTALPKSLDTDAEYQITDAMIWRMLFTGMAGSTFTEDKVPEFYARQRLICEIHGDKPFTVEQVRARVGMKTEVTNFGLRHCNNEKRAPWLTRQLDGVAMRRDDAKAKLDEWTAEARKTLKQKEQANAD